MARSNNLILDGGMSRELIRLNAPFRQPEWSALALLEAPHIVEQVHREFAAAGADVITTNSYALVPFHIGEKRFHEQGEELARLAGRLARAAADEESATSQRRVLVAGSLPPIFGSYEPALFDQATVQDYLSVLVRGLAPYVDFWLGETLSLIAEAEAVKTAVLDTGKPFWVAFTLEDAGVSQHEASQFLRSGESVTEAACWALESGAESLLFNCSRPEVMDAAVREANLSFTTHTRHVRIGVYANAFEPVSDQQAANVGIAQTREDMTAEPYIAFAREWVAHGASIIGGCCGIGREHVELLARTFSRNNSNS